MTLGENIYRLRTEKNMSQGDLADTLNVSRQSVSKWENNSAVPELDKLVRMSELFGITLDELIHGNAQSHGRPNSSNSNGDAAPTAPQFPVRKIVGILLIACGLISIFVPGGLLSVFLFGVPLAVTGAVLTFAEEDYFFRICWLLLAVQFPVIAIFALNFVRSDFAFFMIALVIAVLIAMIIWTLSKFTRNALNRASGRIAVISIALILLLSALFYGLFQMSTPELSHIAEEAYVEEVLE